MADWTSGLDDDQAMSGRNVTAPLDELGIDPDEALTNRSAVLSLVNQNPIQRAQNSYNNAQTNSRSQPVPSVAAAGAIGGAGDSSGPTAASVAPAGSNVTPGKTLGDYGRSGLESLERNMTQATSAAEAEPVEDPEEVSLEAQRARDAAATPQAYDPTTGKLNSQYRPSGWQRVGRGVEGALLGLAGGGLPGAVVGAIKPNVTGSTAYGAPTAQFGRDLERNQQELASDDQQIGAAKDRWKAMLDARKNQAADLRAAAGLGKDLTTGATGLENAETDATVKPIQAEANRQNALNNSPDSKLKLNDQQFNQRQQQANRLGLRGSNRTLYILNGKVPDPRQPTEGEIAMSQAERVFRQQYGRDPQTIEEFGHLAQMAHGQQDRANSGDSTNNRTLLRVTGDHLKSLQSLRSKTFDPNELKSLDDQITQAQKDYDDAKTAVSGGGNNAPAAATPPASGPSIAVIAPDGTRGVIPKANLQKALKRGYRQVTASN